MFTYDMKSALNKALELTELHTLHLWLNLYPKYDAKALVIKHFSRGNRKHFDSEHVENNQCNQKPL
jgi:hypothetical protein